jgi:hypothetical protein
LPLQEHVNNGRPNHCRSTTTMVGLMHHLDPILRSLCWTQTIPFCSTATKSQWLPCKIQQSNHVNMSLKTSELQDSFQIIDVFLLERDLLAIGKAWGYSFSFLMVYWMSLKWKSFYVTPTMVVANALDCKHASRRNLNKIKIKIKM